MQVIPNQSEADSLEYFVNRATSENIVLRLFTNDIAPGAETVTEDFTEASGSGYAAIELTNWDEPTLGEPSLITHPEQTFNFSAGLGPIYGYHMTRATSGRIVAAGRFEDGPYLIPSGGGTIAFTPVITSQTTE
jgi:hypothetical protein